MATQLGLSASLKSRGRPKRNRNLECPPLILAMLGAFFFVAYVGSVVALAVFGLFGMPQVQLGAALLPGVVTGLCIAPLVAERLNPARLRVAILRISASSAVVLLWR